MGSRRTNNVGTREEASCDGIASMMRVSLLYPARAESRLLYTELEGKEWVMGALIGTP